MHFFRSTLRHAMFWGAGTIILLHSSQAIAAEQVILKYRIFRESIPVKDLTALAQTGETSLKLRAYLALARQDPQQVRKTLTQEVKVSPILLDRVLNSRVGDVVLDQVSQAIHTPSKQADRQAMRSALVLSAQGDSKINLIEVIQNYPTQEVEVEGDRLEAVARQLVRLGSRLQNLLGGIRLF